MSRVVVVGAGVGGLAAAMRLAHAGHAVTVLEQAATPGGKCGRVSAGAFAWDAGPSLLTLPQVFEALFEDTGAPLPVPLQRVEPVTRYRFADGTGFELSADTGRSIAALEGWSPGAGADWRRFLATCEGMWRASIPFLTGPPPWPPRRSGSPAPLDLVRVKPWWTLRQLARAHTSDPRLQMVIERFATYAGADPRRAPAALAVAGYVEHAFGAWHPRGGLYALVEAMVARLGELGGELRLSTPVRRVARSRVQIDAGFVPADVVIANADPRPLPQRQRSLSGLAVMLGLRGRAADTPHHAIRFPADYDAELDDVFVHRRPVRDPTVYVSAPPEAPEGSEAWFVLVNAPAVGDAVDWAAEEERLIDRLGVRDRILERARRTPGDLERETGAPGGAIYGRAPHGRLGTLRRPGNAVRDGLWLVGGTTHPGGGLPLVALSGKIVADQIGPA